MAQLLYAQEDLDPVITTACVYAFLLAVAHYLLGTRKGIDAIPPVASDGQPLKIARVSRTSPPVVYAFICVGTLLGCTPAHIQTLDAPLIYPQTLGFLGWISWLIVPLLLIDIMQRASALRSRIAAATQAAAMRVPAVPPTKSRRRRKRSR